MASKNFSQLEGLYDKAAEAPAAAQAAAFAGLEPEEMDAALPHSDHTSLDDPFDYDALTPTTDERFVLKGCRQRIVAVLGEAFLSAGRDLLNAKELIQEKCPRGTWSKWLKNSLSVSETTARNWMDSASWATLCPTVGEMAPGAMYLGAAAPVEVQAKIVKKLENGEAVKASDIKQMIADHRAAGSEIVKGDIEAPSANSAETDPNQSDTVPGKEMESVARELLARLREHFDDESITELLALIDQTSMDAVREVFKESGRP